MRRPSRWPYAPVLRVLVGRSDLEDDVGDRTRRRLTITLAVLLIVGLHLAVGDREERIGYGRILLAGPLAREGPVRGIGTGGRLERIGIGAAADQPEELLHPAFHARLLVELRPSLLRLRIALGARQELAHGSDIVGTRARIGEGVVEGLRHALAADHRQTLRLGEREAQIVEARHQHVLRDEALPCGVGQHGRLLLVALLTAVLLTHAFVLFEILRIVDLLSVDDAHAGILPGEAHLGLQREDECQEGQCDDYRQHDAELGS